MEVTVLLFVLILLVVAIVVGWIISWITNSVGLGVLGAVIAVGMVTLFAGSAVYQYGNVHNVTFKVNDKVSHQSGNSSTYLIYTDKGVYSDSDSVLHGKFNSSDVYGQLQRGHTYDCKVHGHRVHVMSWYENILSCKNA